MKPATHLQLLPSEAPGETRATGAALGDDLALRACAGDVSAWAEVYARHYPQLLRQLRHRHRPERVRAPARERREAELRPDPPRADTRPAGGRSSPSAPPRPSRRRRCRCRYASPTLRIDIITAGVSPSSAYARSHRSATSTSNKIPSSNGTGSHAPDAISASSCPGPQPL